MQIKSIAGILIVFICGITIGFIICHHLIMSRMHHARSRGPKVFHEHIVQKLKNELSLKNKQESEIRSIVEATLTKLHEFHKTTIEVQIQSMFDSAKRDILNILSDQQKITFEKMPPIFGPKPHGPSNRPPHHQRGGPFPPPFHIPNHKSN